MRYILFKAENNFLGDKIIFKKELQSRKKKPQVQTWCRFIKEQELKYKRIDFIDLDEFKMD